MARKSKEELLIFGDDSPLFNKPNPKAQPKKSIVVPPRKRKVDVSDLFYKEPVATPKKRGPKSKIELEEEGIVAENKRIAARRKSRDKKLPKKDVKRYPKVTSPEDCKNILPAFKKYLNAKWELLKGNHTEAQSVASYINGVMTVCKENRPKEYDELYVLRAIAKKVANERN